MNPNRIHTEQQLIDYEATYGEKPEWLIEARAEQREGQIVTSDGEIVELPTEIHDGNAAYAAAKAIEIYKMAKERKKQAEAPWKELQDKAKDIIQRAFQSLDTDSLESNAGKAYVQSTYSQVKYDAKSLDALCASNPKLKEMLWPHRTENERGGWIVIR